MTEGIPIPMSIDNLSHLANKRHRDYKPLTDYHDSVTELEDKLPSKFHYDFMNDDDVLYQELASKRPEFRFQLSRDEVPFLQTLPFLEGRRVLCGEGAYSPSITKLATESRVSESLDNLQTETCLLHEASDLTPQDTTVECISVTEKPPINRPIRSRRSTSLSRDTPTAIKQDSLRERIHQKSSNRLITKATRSPMLAKISSKGSISRTHTPNIDITGSRKKAPSNSLNNAKLANDLKSTVTSPERISNKESPSTSNTSFGCPKRAPSLRHSTSSAISLSISTPRPRNSVPPSIRCLLNSDSPPDKMHFLIPGYDRAVEINMFELFNAGYLKSGDLWTFRRAIQDHLVVMNIRFLLVNQDKSLKVEYLPETGETIPLEIPSLSQLQKRLLELDGTIPREKWKNGATLNYFLVQRDGNPIGSLHQLRELAWRENCVITETENEHCKYRHLQN